MPDGYPWYEVVNGSELEQGDIVPGCRVISTLAETGTEGDGDETKEIAADLVEIDAVVMTQSCDLYASKVDDVLLCPTYSFEELAAEDDKFSRAGVKERIRRGQYTAYHLLDRCDIEDHERGHRVVDLGETYTLPLNHVRNLAERTGDRIRLLPPYREHLAQAFARFYMRVGLPIDIEPFN